VYLQGGCRSGGEFVDPFAMTVGPAEDLLNRFHRLHGRDHHRFCEEADPSVSHYRSDERCCAISPAKLLSN